MQILHLLVTLLPTVLAKSKDGGQKAVYFLHNTNTSDSQIVAMPIQRGGQLGKPVLTSTNGMGGIPISTLSTPAGIFFSQSSVTVGGNYLFTVNSGSNTLAMFTIPPDDPMTPQLVSTVDTMGKFPMSVAYSEALQIVCALNAGGRGGVSCFHVDKKTGLTADGPLRPLDTAFNQTEPPTGPADSASQLVFDPASNGLWVVIKGNPTSKPLTPGVFIEYPVTKGKVATKGTVSQIGDIILNFGTTFFSDSSFLIAAPTFGGAIVSVDKGKLKQKSTITVDGELAICWSAYNKCLGRGYLMDAGRTNVTVVNVANGKQLSPIIATTPGNNGTEGGLYDTAILDNYSYSLADPNGVVVLNLKTGKQAQYFDLTPYGERINFEGMASWPSTTSC